MPIYKGSNEVSSGNLRKGSTEIQNGYKQTDQFYVNTLAITINFVDAISGATMSTTQFSSIGTPGASFSSFTRTITTDSGRIFNGAVTVAEAGDSGNNVNASISGQGSTTATLNVSGTYPTQGVTVTLTVNGATQIQLPNLNVSVSPDSATFSTSNGSSLGTFSYSNSQSASAGGSCSGGTSPGSGTFTTGGSSYGFPGWTAGYPAGGSFGNGCGITCTSSLSGSKSGYNSGSGSASRTGGNPSALNYCSWSPSSNPSGATLNSSGSCAITCPTCVACSGGSSSCQIGLTASLSVSPGSISFGNVGSPNANIFIASPLCDNSTTFTNAVPAATSGANWPINSSAAVTQVPNNSIGGSNAVTGGLCSLSWTYPSANVGISAASNSITCQDTAGTSLTCSGYISSFSGGNNTATSGGAWRISCSGGNFTINASTCSGSFRLTQFTTGEVVNMNF